jgi:hypothetical protein
MQPALTLPETPAEFFDKAGPLTPSLDDKRRFPRFYFRSVAEATIYPLRADQEPAHCYVLTRDLSRSGIGLVHTAQLFPGQRIDLTLNGQEPKRVEVVWCKRQSKDSYFIGCQFSTSNES